MFTLTGAHLVTPCPRVVEMKVPITLNYHYLDIRSNPPKNRSYRSIHQAFFFPNCCAAALALFFCPLLIITMLKKLPTTAAPTNTIATGIRIAQTLGGKKLWSSMFSSTNG